MKTAEVIWMCLPEGLDELFEMVRFDRTEQAYDIWLDEKKRLSDEDYPQEEGTRLSAEFVAFLKVPATVPVE